MVVVGAVVVVVEASVVVKGAAVVVVGAAVVVVGAAVVVVGAAVVVVGAAVVDTAVIDIVSTGKYYNIEKCSTNKHIRSTTFWKQYISKTKTHEV